MARLGIAAALCLTSLILLTAAAARSTASDQQGQVAYAAGGSIYVAAADGSRARRLGPGSAPSWSPNGRAIAFHSARVPNYGLDIYLMDRDGRHQRRVVSHPTAGGEDSDNTKDDFEPSWSPDGAFVAFTTVRDGNAEIYRMDTTGHSTARLTNDPADDREPAWSPDGNSIAFVRNADIFTMRADSTGVRQVTRTSEPEGSPAWSPDGRLLAFESVRAGNADVYVIGSDGSGERRLTTDPAADTRPSWSPDGSSIAFTRSGGLFVTSASGGEARPLIAAGDAPSWQPGVDLALSAGGVGRRLRITVRNRLPAPAFYVALSISAPRNARVVGVRARGGTCRLRPLGCSARTLRSTLSVELILRPRRCGSFTIRSSVSSLQREVEPANNRRRARLAVAC
jgi:Tol biopolymer transport system component